MDVLTAGGFAVAGAGAGIPIAAIAYSAPPAGSLRLPDRWWRGSPAPPRAVATVSLLAGVAAGIITDRLPFSLALPAYWLFAVLGVGLAIIDLRRHRLPHVLTGTLWITCSASMVIASATGARMHHLLEAASAGVAVTALALVVALALPGQLGLGDVSLSGVIALSLAWLSLDTAALGLVAGIALQTTYTLAKLLRRKAQPSQIPFGPALLLGWLVAILNPPM